MTDNKEIFLYHGSYCEVKLPDIRKCRDGKDFGRGFYLTTDKEQAARFTKTSVLKTKRDGRITDDAVCGYVSEFSFSIDSSPDVKIMAFEHADRDWLHCVAAYRKTNSGISTEKWDGYDLVTGKIANDRTNMVITAYLDGAYGPVGSQRADEIAISLLEPQNLKDQFCFRTELSLQLICFTKCERIEL